MSGRAKSSCVVVVLPPRNSLTRSSSSLSYSSFPSRTRVKCFLWRDLLLLLLLLLLLPILLYSLVLRLVMISPSSPSLSRTWTSCKKWMTSRGKKPSVASSWKREQRKSFTNNPTNVTSVNLVMGCSKIFFLLFQQLPLRTNAI